MTDQLSRRTFAKLAGAAALGASNVPLAAKAAHAATLQALYPGLVITSSPRTRATIEAPVSVRTWRSPIFCPDNGLSSGIESQSVSIISEARRNRERIRY